MLEREHLPAGIADRGVEAPLSAASLAAQAAGL
jgi:hypothetical protein